MPPRPFKPPCDFPRRSKRQHVPRIVALKVQDRILAAIPDDRRGVFLALRLGIRLSEGRAFNVADYDFRTGVLDVRWAMQGQTHGARAAQVRRKRHAALSKQIPSSADGSSATFRAAAGSRTVRSSSTRKRASARALPPAGHVESRVRMAKGLRCVWARRRSTLRRAEALERLGRGTRWGFAL